MNMSHCATRDGFQVYVKHTLPKYQQKQRSMPDHIYKQLAVKILGAQRKNYIAPIYKTLSNVDYFTVPNAQSSHFIKHVTLPSFVRVQVQKYLENPAPHHHDNNYKPYHSVSLPRTRYSFHIQLTSCQHNQQKDPPSRVHFK